MQLDTDYTVHAVRMEAPVPEQSVQDALDRGRLRDVTELAGTDPIAARSAIDHLSTPYMRDVAMASILPQYVAAGSPKAADLAFRDVEVHIESMKSSPAKLRLEVKLASAFLQLKRTADARVTVGHAFDLGQELFSQDRLAHPRRSTLWWASTI